MQDRETDDFRKLDLVEPTPKWLCTRVQGECMYCKYDAPHPSTTLSDWSSEDWDGEKAKAREQYSLIDFKQLEWELNQTLQDPTWDVPSKTLDNKMPDKSLADDFQALTLKENGNLLNSK